MATGADEFEAAYADLRLASYRAAFRLLGFPQNILGRVQGDSSSIRGLTARAYRLPLRNPTTNRAPLDLAEIDRHIDGALGPVEVGEQRGSTGQYVQRDSDT